MMADFKLPIACPGSGELVDAGADTHEVTCRECGRVVPVRTDRRIKRHQAPTNEPAAAGKDT